MNATSEADPRRLWLVPRIRYSLVHTIGIFADGGTHCRDVVVDAQREEEERVAATFCLASIGQTHDQELFTQLYDVSFANRKLDGLLMALIDAVAYVASTSDVCRFLVDKLQAMDLTSMLAKKSADRMFFGAFLFGLGHDRVFARLLEAAYFCHSLTAELCDILPQCVKAENPLGCLTAQRGQQGKIHHLQICQNQEPARSARPKTRLRG